MVHTRNLQNELCENSSLYTLSSLWGTCRIYQVSIEKTHIKLVEQPMLILRLSRIYTRRNLQNGLCEDSFLYTLSNYRNGYVRTKHKIGFILY